MPDNIDRISNEIADITAQIDALWEDMDRPDSTTDFSDHDRGNCLLQLRMLAGFSSDSVRDLVEKTPVWEPQYQQLKNDSNALQSLVITISDHQLGVVPGGLQEAQDQLMEARGQIDGVFTELKKDTASLERRAEFVGYVFEGISLAWSLYAA